MRPHLSALALAAFILSACTATPQTPPVATPVPAHTSTPVPPPVDSPVPQRAPLLRVAIFGETTTTNVWALFDEAGADYWNYAIQADYWPRLYRLAPPYFDFKPASAEGMPSPLNCGTDICTATVTIQPNLTWTDGTPLTADDVVFTINTAIQFRLGLNWAAAYDPDVIDRVEALDETTVRYYFKVRPSVAEWQYGALLGPVVNQAYWRPRIVDAVDLLPDEMLLPMIRELETELADMQTRVEGLYSSLNTMAPASTVYQDTTKQAERIQEELNSISNKLEKSRAEYEGKLAEAQEVLFMLANANEPTLGPWRFASRIENNFENQANLHTPFEDPWFDSVRYITYTNEPAAVKALLNDEVDMILSIDSLSTSAVPQLEDDSEITLARNVTRSARFLAFNHANLYLADPVLHQALACMIDPQMLMERLDGDAAPLPGFVLDGFWQHEEASLPCADITGDARLEQAVSLLKDAGYSWSTEPAPDVEGQELQNSDGDVLPSFVLLTPEQDPVRAKAAEYIAERAQKLGLTIEVQLSNPDDLLYAVYGSRDYDMALLGWRLSAYPAYLCEWFMPLEQNPFAYNGSKPVLSGGEGLGAECEAWDQVSDLDEAKMHVFEVQSALMQDLPLIPLYSEIRIDAYRDIHYPFDNFIDGFAGLYGGTSLAIPNP